VVPLQEHDAVRRRGEVVLGQRRELDVVLHRHREIQAIGEGGGEVEAFEGGHRQAPDDAAGGVDEAGNGDAGGRGRDPGRLAGLGEGAQERGEGIGARGGSCGTGQHPAGCVGEQAAHAAGADVERGHRPRGGLEAEATGRPPGTTGVRDRGRRRDAGGPQLGQHRLDGRSGEPGRGGELGQGQRPVGLPQHDRAVARVGEPHGRGVGVSVGHRSFSRRRPPAPLRKGVSQWSGQSAPSSRSRQVLGSVPCARWETGSMESLAPSVPPLHQTYADAVPELSVPWRADAPPRPEIVWLNEPLALELGFAPQWLRGEEGLALFTGQIDGTTAQAYAGHQFGSPNPQLGDGRAVLLGDLLDTDGRRRDLHLKGAGRTPFARGGDGKAPLGPMLREAVFGEWLHAVGAPTTRALAVLSTGEQIAPRQGVTPEPGALLVRVAASHLRVGTFEYATWHLDEEVRERLLEHTLLRHHPSADGPLGLLEAVTADQAELVARWMLLGFVHGVMNTDNMALSGEGMDYGPCAALDAHRRDAVFSTLARGGRYAYGNQPGIALWNLSRFAETLLPLIDEADPNRAVERATAVLEQFEHRYREAWAQGMARKLGIEGSAEEVTALGAGLFEMLEAQQIDHTGCFRALAEGRAAELLGDAPSAARWMRRREALGAAAPEEMEGINPLYVPRNVHLDAALRAAHLGDLGPVQDLLEAVTSPFTPRAGLEHLEGPGEGGEHFMTFCGT